MIFQNVKDYVVVVVLIRGLLFMIELSDPLICKIASIIASFPWVGLFALWCIPTPTSGHSDFRNSSWCLQRRDVTTLLRMPLQGLSLACCIMSQAQARSAQLVKRLGSTRLIKTYYAWSSLPTDIFKYIFRTNYNSWMNITWYYLFETFQNQFNWGVRMNIFRIQYFNVDFIYDLWKLKSDLMG